MAKKAKKIDVFAKSVEKRKKSQHVGKSDRRSNSNLSRGIYRPLEQRAIRDEPVLSRLHSSKRRSNVVDDEMNDLPASDFQRKYAT